MTIDFEAHHSDLDTTEIEARSRPRQVYLYRVFDLFVQSDIRLEELRVAAEGVPDITIHLGRVEHPALKRDLCGTAFDFGTDRHLLAWEAVGAFLIQGDDTIIVEPREGCGPRLLALPLLGPVFAVVLHLRGFLVLHASALQVNGKGAIFVGDKGAGKSTTAGAFMAAGHYLVTDDIVALRTEADGSLSILPAIAQLKLMQDAAEALALEGCAKQAEVHPTIAKRQHWVTDGFAQEPVPAKAVLVLARAEVTQCVELAASDALASILQFSYVGRFGNSLIKGANGFVHLRQCAALVRKVPVARFEIASGLHRIGEAVTMVEDKLRDA